MKSSSKNYLLIAEKTITKGRFFFLLLGLFNGGEVKSQLANYVSNGSFEEYYDCVSPYPLSKAKYWLTTDSSLNFGGIYVSTCNQSVPNFGPTYQYPKTGDAYIVSTFYCQQPCGDRGYLKNRLKKNLTAGSIYCVKFHVNILNLSPYSLDGFGIYFGNGTIDTITKRKNPLTYLMPQVKNQLGNVITDTCNWIPITGTFVANGTEKYALIGNFLSDAAVTTVSLNSPYFPEVWTDVNIDDVSCIDIDLPAFAGKDTMCIPGTSVYIGRTRDVGIDEACMWYIFPNMTTAIDTAAGLWVSPVVTTSYVVRQEICGNVKWDTVVVHQTALGLKSFALNALGINLYPVPADDVLTIEIDSATGNEENFTLTILNNLGQVVREEELSFKNKSALVKTNDLNTGVYSLTLKSGNLQTVSKRFVIGR